MVRVNRGGEGRVLTFFACDFSHVVEGSVKPTIFLELPWGKNFGFREGNVDPLSRCTPLTYVVCRGTVPFIAQVMSIPEVSAVFEAFSRKALCQESFLFLKDVTT